MTTVAETIDRQRAALAYQREPHPAGQRLRTVPGRWEQATNRSQRALVQAYDDWGRALRPQLRRAALEGAPAARLGLLIEAAAADLADALRSRARDALRLAAGLGVSRALGASPEVQALIASRVLQSDRLITQTLIPAITTQLAATITPAVAVDRVALAGAFLPLRSRVATYAGGAWVMLFETQRAVGMERERAAVAAGEVVAPVRWVLDARAEHCAPSPGFFGCPELAGRYPDGWSSLPTVPAGQVTCRGNCKCVIEVQIAGRWQRGLS